MAHTIEFRPGARRDFQRLSPDGQSRLRLPIDALAQTPRPPGCKKLRGATHLWRVRVGDCRIVYQIHDAVLLVVVVTIAHRREVYH